MSEILLSLHVFAGICAITAALHGLVPALRRLQPLFWPAIAAVSASGVGMMFSGVSVVRVCISGALMVAALIAIQQITIRRAALVHISTPDKR